MVAYVFAIVGIQSSRGKYNFRKYNIQKCD